MLAKPSLDIWKSRIDYKVSSQSHQIQINQKMPYRVDVTLPTSLRKDKMAKHLHDMQKYKEQSSLKKKKTSKRLSNLRIIHRSKWHTSDDYSSSGMVSEI